MPLESKSDSDWFLDNESETNDGGRYCVDHVSSDMMKVAPDQIPTAMQST